MAKGSKRKANSSQCNTTEKDVTFPSTLLEDKFNTYKASIDVLLPTYIFVVHNFFSPTECQRWIDYAEKSGQLEHTQQRATRYMASRECDRMQQDDKVTAQRLFERLNPFLDQLELPSGATGCNGNLRLYKYEKGHAFSKHIDGSNLVDNGMTRYTILIYLSECRGGGTAFETPYGDSTVVFQPKAGSLLLHLHGDDCLLHEGLKVQSGTKYVLRTDLVYPK